MLLITADTKVRRRPTAATLGWTSCWVLACAAVMLATDANGQPVTDRSGPAAVSAPATSAAKPRGGSLPADPEGKRATPRRAWAGFAAAMAVDDADAAAQYLDLRGLPAARDKREARELATMLGRVLEWHVAIAPEALPDEADPSSTPPSGIVLDTVDVDGETHTISLARVRLATGELVWMFPKSTVSSIRPIFDANQRRWVETRVPEWGKGEAWLGLRAWQWVGVVLLGGIAFGGGRLVGSMLALVARLFAGRLETGAQRVIAAIARPLRLAAGAALFQLASPYLLLPAALDSLARRVTDTLYVVAIAWALSAFVRQGTSAWAEKLSAEPEDDHGTRALRTRLAMLSRIGTLLVSVVAGGVILLQFDVVRNVGLSLLASAGIAGVLVGFAAQRTLGGIISGIEMSITQPIRIGDIVAFKRGEVGTVEEIYFTYVIVHLWDERRQIVPVTRIMSETFDNWTRTARGLLAPVDLWVDPSAPVDRLRAAFVALCEQSELWDGRICRVQVVEINERAMRLQGLGSVADAATAFDLRCELREGWIRSAQELENGRFLPRFRVDGPISPT